MSDSLEIKWPWSLTYLEYTDDLIAQIKEALPPDHPLQEHEIFPEIKWDKRPIFIVEDKTTGEQFLMNFERRKRWKKTKLKVPTVKVFKNTDEIRAMIERDHLAECAKYNPDGSLRNKGAQN